MYMIIYGKKMHNFLNIIITSSFRLNLKICFCSDKVKTYQVITYIFIIQMNFIT